jgi:chromosome segregation ATPase
MQNQINSNADALKELRNEIAAAETRARDRLVSNRDRLQGNIAGLQEKVYEHTPKLASLAKELEWIKLHLEEVEERCEAP